MAAADFPALQALAESRGWRLTVLSAHGAVRLRHLVQGRALLAAGALAFLAGSGPAYHPLSSGAVVEFDS